MALIHTIRQVDGHEASYHKVSRVSCYFGNRSVSIIITVLSFTDKMTRDRNSENWCRIRDYYAHVTYDEFDKIDCDIRKFAYNYLKTIEEFIDSKDG